MAISYGSEINAVVSPGKQVLSTNYVDLSSSGWAQQYLPDLMEKEAEVFGNRTISGFLSQVGAEEAMQSDQVVWSEQGRLHLCYKGRMKSATTPACAINNISLTLIPCFLDVVEPTVVSPSISAVIAIVPLT